jgi:Flp pilus assembly protein TadD
LLKAQALARLGQLPAAEAALALVPEGQRADEVAYRKAAIEAQRGQLDKARERLRQLPADSSEQRERRLLLEVQLLRENAKHQQAFDLLTQALVDDPTDTSLLYEHAMSAERLGRNELMEQQLRRIIELDPKHHHAHNALGYSLADRNLRLAEARSLIERAIELGGHEPFLVDSLGWVAFREGRLDEAERLLRQAHRARPDAEIAAHLTELLWQQGRQQEARELARQAEQREPDNAVLKALRKRLGL